MITFSLQFNTVSIRFLCVESDKLTYLIASMLAYIVVFVFFVLEGVNL